MKSYNKEREKRQNRIDQIHYLYKHHYYDEALHEVNDILKVYPDNIGMLSMKAGIYRHYKDFDMAESILDSIPNHNKDSIMELIRLYTCIEKYDEALTLMDNLDGFVLTDKDKDQLAKLEMVILKHKYPARFVKKYLFDKDYINDDYFVSQILNYSAKTSIKYLKKVKETRLEGDKPYSSRFNEDFDIEKEYIEIRKQLHKYDKNKGTLFDEYYIYYPNCGTRVGEVCNYVKVYTLKGTHNIMKMLPIASHRVYKQNKKDEIDYSLYPTHKKDMIKRFNDRFKKRKTI